MIRTMADIMMAHEAGQEHTQHFYKGTTQGGFDGCWYDWSYATGHPIYDARVGTALTFTPYINTAHNGIWYPTIPAGMSRHITGIDMCALPFSTNQTTQTHLLYDLLGVYSLIDGDSGDVQTFTNTATIPRYTDGIGVRATLVNNVAPSANLGSATMVYIDDANVQKTVTFNVGLFTVNTICVTGSASSTLSRGQHAIPLASGSKGVKSVVSITFNTPPSGLWAIYLYKPITQITVWKDPFNDPTGARTQWTEKCMCLNNGFNFPRIYDGASLGFFSQVNVSNRAVASYFGHIQFVWG